jgi:hypothetical protein
MAIKLSGWGHEVVLRVEAQRSSFSALSCPTEDGFAVSCLREQILCSIP